MTRILSISGKAQHGKDTAAALAVEIAKEEFGQTLGRYAFAWPLKARVYGEAYFKFPLEDVLYNKPEGLRDLLQQVGTEQGRKKFGDEFWMLQAEAMLRLMTDAMPNVAGWVVSDCRFPNEVEFVRLGGKPSAPVRLGARQSALTQLDYTPEREELLLATDPGALMQLDDEYDALFESLYAKELAAGSGLALWIDSDRPTLTGKAALHASETALDALDKDTDFDGRLGNYTTTSLAALKDQVRPFVARLLGQE